MSWQNRIDFSQSDSKPATEPDAIQNMKPGLTGNYNRILRENAGVRDAPIAPACMGLLGEYDPYGMAKRVAQALDQQPRLLDQTDLSLVQKGTKIIYAGRVSDSKALETIVEITSRVDGTHAVDVSQVAIAPSDSSDEH